MFQFMHTASPSSLGRSQSLNLVCWAIFALTLITLSVTPVGATASHSATKSSNNLQPTSLVDALAGHAYGKSTPQSSKKQENDKKKYQSMAKGGAFAGLGAFSNLPEQPLWGLETDKHKVPKSKKEQASKSLKTHSSSKPSPTSVSSDANAYVQENASRDLDGSLSLELSQLLGPAFSGALKLSGGVGLDYSSSSGQHPTTSSSKQVLSTSSPSTSSQNRQLTQTATHSSHTRSDGGKSAHTSYSVHTSKSQGKSAHASSTRSHTKSTQSKSKHASTSTGHARSTQGNAEHTSTTAGHAHTSSAAQPPQANLRTDKSQFSGFYRIGLTEDSTPVLIQSVKDNDQNTSEGARVAAVVSANEPGGNLQNQSVITNNPNYGFLEAQDDLYAIREWAGDMGRLVSKENRNETLMALFSAASRYYPDVDTKAVVRIMLADIKAESDFETENESSGRLDSGNSIGLLQISPYGSSNELKQFQTASTFQRNVYSWCVGNGTDVEVQYGGESVLGPLRAFDTGKVLSAGSLTTADLTKPWINIHIAMWLQTNHARTGSQDPSLWPKVSSSSKNVRAAYQPALLEILTGSTSATSSAGSNTSTSYSATTYTTKLNTLHKRLIGANAQKTTFATGLGSWVAGPSDDSDGYNTSGDDVSTQYFKNIGKGLSVMYTGSTKQWQAFGKNWLDTIQLTPGLIDYAK